MVDRRPHSVDGETLLHRVRGPLSRSPQVKSIGLAQSH
jgi:hypothetical protein